MAAADGAGQSPESDQRDGIVAFLNTRHGFGAPTLLNFTANGLCGSHPERLLQQLEHLLRRSTEHCLVTTHDDRTLDQDRVR